MNLKSAISKSQRNMFHSLTLNVVFMLATLCMMVCATEEHHKRAPSGFTGVRGKKSIPDSFYNGPSSNSESITSDATADDDDIKAVDVISVTGSVNKRAPSGFMGMRGKKPYTQQLWDMDNDIIYKRAPSGFMGMRGKKDMEFTNYGDDLKRAPSGFMGMRGKKTYETYFGDKRAPMGFMGMRGKKSYDDIKRAGPSSAGFFGMRGKKQPTKQSGFFGMRGKKYPYEFRGKFVGVRGKKMSTDNVNGPDYYYDLSNLGQELDINQLMLLLTENNGDNNNGLWDSNEMNYNNGQFSQNLFHSN